MGLTASQLLGLVFTVFILLLYVVVILRFLHSRFAKPKTVKAEVVGKQTVEQFSKYGKKYKYAVTFLVEGKKKYFYVNEFSYNGYHKGERGMLTYRGDRLIDFS